MKNLLFIFLLLSINCKSVDFTSKIYVGHISGNPVFEDTKDRTLHIFNGITFESIFKYDSQLSLTRVRDSLMLFTYKDKTSKSIFIKKGSESIIRTLDCRTPYVVNIDTNTIFYTDIKNDLIIKSTNSKYKLSKKGYVVDCLGDNLYYTKDISDNENPNIVLYKLSVTNNKEEIILNGITGEDIIITDNVIYDKKLDRGLLNHYFYNVISKKETLIPEHKYKIVFYFPARMSFWGVNIKGEVEKILVTL